MEFKVAVIGLGYVGLPLASAAGKLYPTVGFDINVTRIAELKVGYDRTKEVTLTELKNSIHLSFSANSSELSGANFYIVTVPTPVDEYKKPDLRPLESATRTIAPHLKRGDIVVYESTVFPGCTEDVCVPILEQISNLKFNLDFYAGYSPERINPGDKLHNLATICKVTSGSTPEIADIVDAFYRSIVTAGTHKASSIKVAEAAKVIENAQRDINIAFVNELSVIFEKMNIDTTEVLQAAGTKWNFLNFKPGLVGGHCIGVDPYYLTHKAEGLGYKPEVILAGRRLNDRMGQEIAQRTIRLMGLKKQLNPDTKVLILGITFKENCPDIRNSKVIDIIHELKSFNLEVEVHDPNADVEEVLHEYGFSLLSNFDPQNYAAIILAVSHDQFLKFDWSFIRRKVKVIFDVKGILDRSLSDARL